VQSRVPTINAAPTVFPGLAERRIEPARRRIRLRDIPTYADVVRVLAARDFRAKYKQSILGPLWVVFQPLALLGAFVVGFHGVTHVHTGSIPYVVFALTGLCVWSYFQAALTMATFSIVGSHPLVRFTPCPRLAFPAAALVATLPSLAVPLLASLVAAVATDHLSPRVVLLPLAVIWLLLTTWAITAISSAITVRFRDLTSALPFLLQVAVLLAPVAYPLTSLPSGLRVAIFLNPLSGIIEASRWLILDTGSLYVTPVVISLAMTVLALPIAWRFFTRVEPLMADLI
jgi:lipopolysaccharide transport system permease protein